MELIGLLGYAGTGKNYIAENVLSELLPKKNTVVLAFADHFKVDAVIKFGADYDKVFGKKDYKTRSLLQKIGTEEGRNKFGDDIWIKSIDTWIKVLHSRGVERFIISDCRFINEVEWIKSLNGTVIKINAPKRRELKLMQETNGDITKINEIKNHASEIEIEKCIYDTIINNDPEYNPFESLKILYDSN